MADESFSKVDAKLAKALIKLAKKAHIPEREIFIRSLRDFSSTYRNYDGLWLSLEDITWFEVFGVDNNSELCEAIDDYLYRTTKIAVASEPYDYGTLLVYVQ